jgi:hypothetical protein
MTHQTDDARPGTPDRDSPQQNAPGSQQGRGSQQSSARSSGDGSSTRRGSERDGAGKPRDQDVTSKEKGSKRGEVADEDAGEDESSIER